MEHPVHIMWGLSDAALRCYRSQITFFLEQSRRMLDFDRHIVKSFAGNRLFCRYDAHIRSTMFKTKSSRTEETSSTIGVQKQIGVIMSDQRGRLHINRSYYE